MKKFLIATVLSAILVSSANADSNYILAKVNGHDIKRAEIDKVLKGITNGQAVNAPNFDKLPPDVQKAFIDKYIDKVLIIDAAQKQGLEKDPEVQRKLAEAKDFLIQEKYLNDLVNKDKSDENLKKLYDEKIKSQTGKEEVHAEHILVKTEEEAKKLKSQIDKGADFEKLAKTNSTEPGAKMSGGDLGYFTAEQMVPEFSNIAFKLKTSEVSQPVQTQFGWHLIKVLDKRTAKVPTFAEAKPELERIRATQVIDDTVKKLKSQATVEYFGTLANSSSTPLPKPLVKKVDETTK